MNYLIQAPSAGDRLSKQYLDSECRGGKSISICILSRSWISGKQSPWKYLTQVCQFIVRNCRSRSEA